MVMEDQTWNTAIKTSSCMVRIKLVKMMDATMEILVILKQVLLVVQMCIKEIRL